MARNSNAFQRASTRFSRDSRTVFVRLRVARRNYEFARFWAEFHAEADPEGTAEDQLEGYLNMALLSHLVETGWVPPEEVGDPRQGNEAVALDQKDLDDELPF